jgi:pyrroline-5-carboxylate reductase
MSWNVVARDGLVLLGCGKMGTALWTGWLAAGVPPGSVWVIEPNPTDWLKGAGRASERNGLPPRPPWRCWR